MILLTTLSNKSRRAPLNFFLGFAPCRALSCRLETDDTREHWTLIWKKLSFSLFSAVTKVCAQLRLHLPFLDQWTDFAEILTSDLAHRRHHFFFQNWRYSAAVYHYIGKMLSFAHFPLRNVWARLLSLLPFLSEGTDFGWTFPCICLILDFTLLSRKGGYSEASDHNMEKTEFSAFLFTTFYVRQPKEPCFLEFRAPDRVCEPF